MVALKQLKPVTFDSRVFAFNEQIQDETKGELSIEPLPCGYINLLYKKQWIARLHIGGLKQADIYERIETIFKACVCFWSIEVFEQ